MKIRKEYMISLIQKSKMKMSSFIKKRYFHACVKIFNSFLDMFIKISFKSAVFITIYFLVNELSSGMKIPGGTLLFYDLSLPLITSFLILYNYKAIPVLGLFLISSFCVHPFAMFLESFSRITAAVISVMLYYCSTGKRGVVSFGRSKLTALRVGWLVLFNTLIYNVLHENLFVRLHMISPGESGFPNVSGLINIQWMMISCLTGIPLCYLVIRGMLKPIWFLRYLKQAKEAILYGSSRVTLAGWLLVLTGIMYCLIDVKSNVIIFTDYSLLWLLPVMIWGVLLLGHQITSLLWSIILILLGNYVNNYISLEDEITLHNFLNHLALSSAMLFIFSIIIVLVGVLSSRIHHIVKDVERMSVSEPGTGLPNIEALKHELHNGLRIGLCMVQYPELNVLMQAHGVAFGTEFVKALTRFLHPHLKSCDSIYYISETGVIIRFDNISNILIEHYFHTLSLFRFTWNDMRIGVNFGLAYTEFVTEVHQLPFVIGQLSSCCLNSLRKGKPEELKFPSLEKEELHSGVIRHELQKVIDKQTFMLFAQPIVSCKSELKYYEILIRIKMHDKVLYPDSFLPVAEEAGLLANVDMAVIEQTFRFIQVHQSRLADMCFSLNLTPHSIIRSHFLMELNILFSTYQINKENIIFEIIESDIIEHDTVSSSLRDLRMMGCRIAIDDFGAGASGYSRLKTLDVDIMKIDGSYVRNITTDEFDRLSVISFCEAAKLKKMDVVAEFVENEETKEMLKIIGVDWLQGYHIGKPFPVELLIS